MVTNIQIKEQFKGNGNMWKITFYKDDMEYGWEHIREISLISLYHCLARELNNKYDCNFSYEESEIKRCYNHQTYGKNSEYNRNWYLRKEFNGRLSVFHETFLKVSQHTNYGTYDLEDIILIIAALGEWLKTHDVHRLSYENCKQMWLIYRDSHIKFEPYEEYRHFYDADPDFSAEAFKKSLDEHCKRVWEAQSANAITLWNQPYEEVKVEITKKNLKFFRRDDIFSCYVYPPLHELKKDPQFIKDITEILEESCEDKGLKDLESWLQTETDLPQFPISYIFASNYQNYKFIDYE